MWELAGRKTQRAGATKLYPLNLALGHFLKPYFKDKVSGVVRVLRFFALLGILLFITDDKCNCIFLLLR